MADVREVFTVLEDSTGAGNSWVKKNEGDSVTSVDLAPVITAVDKDGQFVLLPVEVEGEAIGNAVPVLAAKDESGNLAYLPVVGGQVVVTDKPKGTKLRGVDTVTAVLNTMTAVTDASLTIGKTIQDIVCTTSNTFSTLWELVSIDDTTETTLARWLTGPGQFSFTFRDENLEFVAGAVTPKLQISGKQFVGAVSDMHAEVSCYQLD